MAQISVLAASQAQTSWKSHLLKAARPTDRPTKTYFPDTARQLALSVTYQKREKMSVPNCILISHAKDTFLAFSPENADLFYKGNLLTHSFPTRAREEISHLCHRDWSVLGMRKFSPIFPLPTDRRGFKSQELRSIQPSHSSAEL